MKKKQNKVYGKNRKKRQRSETVTEADLDTREDM